MNLAGTGGTHQFYNLDRSGAAHDRVIHQDDTPALDGAAVGVMLQLDTKMANLNVILAIALLGVAGWMKVSQSSGAPPPTVSS